MLIHSARKKVSEELALKVETVNIEQVHKFKFLGVVVNDTGENVKFHAPVQVSECAFLMVKPA